MKKIYLRFYGDLQDFLPEKSNLECFSQDGEIYHYTFRGRQTAKDVIESLGVPHTEVDLILIDSEPRDFTYLLQTDDFMSVYPLFNNIALADKYRLIPRVTEKINFVLDIHLGKLASYLRMLGFDTLYSNKYTDPELADISSKENRMLLTKDLGLLKRKKVRLGYYVRKDNPRGQLIEVVKRFSLLEKRTSPGRCPECNASLKEIAKDKIIHRLEPLTKKYYQEFSLCPKCDKIYWPGSHYQHLNNLLGNLQKKINNC